MAAWDNYVRLKGAGKVALSVRETVSGVPFIATNKTSFDPETGTPRPATEDVTDMAQAKARELELTKELNSLAAWQTDAQVLIDEWYVEQAEGTVETRDVEVQEAEAGEVETDE